MCLLNSHAKYKPAKKKNIANKLHFMNTNISVIIYIVICSVPKLNIKDINTHKK